MHALSCNKYQAERESSIDKQIRWLGMSVASLERTADWWESFITHAVCPDPHPLRQCNLTVALTQTNLCMRYASFPTMTSLMMSPVWVGDGYLIQTHQRATTPPQTHTHTTALHESPCPHPITPPCPSCRGTSLALCISSTSTEQSAAQWHHDDSACRQFIRGLTTGLSHHEWKIPGEMGSTHFCNMITEITGGGQNVVDGVAVLCNHTNFRENVNWYTCVNKAEASC